MQMSLTGSDNILKNFKNRNLRPNLWQNSSEVGLASKKFSTFGVSDVIHFDLLKF